MGKPKQQPHEYVRGGTAKLLTLFHPKTGKLHVKGVKRSTNAVLHPWLKQELKAIVAKLPEHSKKQVLTPEQNRALWQRWQEGLTCKFTLAQDLPPLRMLLIWDNLAGHKTAELICWFMDQGIMPLYTPLAGSWLNMAESVQRIISRRALAGQHPENPEQIIDWLEATATHWNQHPTPFEWGGKRQARRVRARQRRHALGASGACTTRPVRRKPRNREWLSA